MMDMIVNNSFRLSMNRNQVTIRTTMCQPMDQNIDFSGSDQIQTPQYPDVHPPSQEKSDEVFQANHSIQNKENLENSSNPNQEKEEPPQESDIRQLIREECCVEVSEEQKQITPILTTKEPEHPLSMGYEHLNITPETESDEVTESNAENLLPIPSECKVTLEDKRDCDVPVSTIDVCDDHSEILSDSKIDDDISVYDDDFKDIEYVEASLYDPEIVSIAEENGVEEENVIQQEEEEVDLEDISQIQDVVLREKLLSITRLISNIESLNDNPTPDRMLISFESNNFLLDNFSPEFETFCDHSEETRSGNTTHADNSLPEYDLFCFEIELNQERLINLVKKDIHDDSSNDLLLEEADLFLAFDSLTPPGIENFTDDPEGDIRFLEELLIDDSIISHELSDSNFEDNPSILRHPLEPPDDETNVGKEIPVVMNEKDEDVDYSSFIFVIFDKMFSLLYAESEDTIFNPVAQILSTKEPEHSLSMVYEHPNTTLVTELDEVAESSVKNLVPIPSECEVALEDKRECDVPISENSPVCYNHSDIFSDSKDDDDISIYDDFEDVEYVEASLSDPEIVSVEEENVVQHEEKEVDFEDISQIQDIVLHEKLLSITHLISNIESLNDNPTPDRVLNSFASNNSISNNFLPEFETFCDHTKETRSGNTTHANDSLPEYDSFCFKIEPDQERLINLVENDILDDSTNDPLLEEADLFLAADHSIPPGIENFYDSEEDIRFLEALLIDDSILSHESSDSNFEDNLLIPRPPPEPPDTETDAGEEIPIVMNDKDEDIDYSSFIFVMFDKVFYLLSAESEDTIFDPGISD
nr:hypothetical protein [Tanacetum cinerariifolium]